MEREIALYLLKFAFFPFILTFLPLSPILSLLCAQSCPTLCDPKDCSPPGSFVHGDSPGKNTGLDCYAFLQRIFPTQGSNQVSCIAGRFFTWATREAQCGYDSEQFFSHCDILSWISYGLVSRVQRSEFSNPFWTYCAAFILTYKLEYAEVFFSFTSWCEMNQFWFPGKYLLIFWGFFWSQAHEILHCFALPRVIEMLIHIRLGGCWFIVPTCSSFGFCGDTFFL